jgi:NAD(P)-dependent dehydrogenase (short-subunit alcohol dehydrogenase family)
MGNGRLGGKVALITGGNSGIGLATAKRFVEEGALVYVTGRRQAALDAAVAGIGKGAVVPVLGDVNDPADLDRLYAQIGRDHGRLDIVFANAGFDEFGRLGEITEDHFDQLFGTNVKGLLFTVQKALPLLPDGASVVLNGSVVSIKGIEGMGVYNATKAAVRSFARTWAAELKGRGIRVNVVSPGPIDTPGLELLVGGPENAAGFKAAMAGSVPLGRVGSADEIAKAVVFLASSDASFVNGVELFVDGGMAQV